MFKIWKHLNDRFMGYSKKKLCQDLWNALYIFALAIAKPETCAVYQKPVTQDINKLSRHTMWNEVLTQIISDIEIDREEIYFRYSFLNTLGDSISDGIYRPSSTGGTVNTIGNGVFGAGI